MQNENSFAPDLDLLHILRKFLIFQIINLLNFSYWIHTETVLYKLHLAGKIKLGGRCEDRFSPKTKEESENVTDPAFRMELNCTLK